MWNDYLGTLMTNKRTILFFLLGIYFSTNSASAQFGSVLLSDEFESESGHWKSFCLDGSLGSYEISEGALKIQLASGEASGTYYSATPFSGHFEVEVQFSNNHGVGLALIKSIEGKPSLNDYSMIAITESVEGVIEVKLIDKQKGQKDVYDHTGLAKRSRYKQLLTGSVYSIPFTQTAGRLRILRHENEQFMHFYYAVEKEINGELYQDWIELAPSKEWSTEYGAYYIGLFSLNETAHFDNVVVRRLPSVDKKDKHTGFAITHRPYTWSGYTDSALVVTFGEESFLAKEDRKFVFWRLANNVPLWHLNNHALFLMVL